MEEIELQRARATVVDSVRRLFGGVENAELIVDEACPIIHRLLEYKAQGKNVSDPSAMLPPRGNGVKPVALYTYTRVLKPILVVETGVCAGISTVFILEALVKNGGGELWSIDILEQLSLNYTIGWLVDRFDLKSRWRFILGDSETELEKMTKQPGFEMDMFLHDAEPHTYQKQMHEYTLAYPKIRSGGLLITDDAAAAMHDFKERHHHTAYSNIGGMGTIRKP